MAESPKANLSAENSHLWQVGKNTRMILTNGNPLRHLCTCIYIYIVYIYIYTYTSYIEIHLPAFLKCQSFPGILRVATRHLESTGGEKDFRLPQGGGKGSSLGLSFLTMGVSTLNKKRC